MKSLIIAFAMYSKFPMPRVDWEKKALSWALCGFPLLGLAVGSGGEQRNLLFRLVQHSGTSS